MHCYRLFLSPAVSRQLNWRAQRIPSQEKFALADFLTHIEPEMDSSDAGTANAERTPKKTFTGLFL
jgi:hypothetical protein